MKKKAYNLCEVKQKGINDEEIGELMTQLIVENQEKEQLLVQKQKQVQQLEFMIQSLQLGIQKRDGIIQEIRQENIELKDENVELRNRHPAHSQSMATSGSPKNKRVNLMESQSLESPSKFDYHTHKKLKRARTKENNFDESLQKILENDYGTILPTTILENMNYFLADYYELQHLITIKNLISSEENFIQTIQKLDFVGIVNIFDAISLVLQEHKSLFQNVIKLRRLFECSLELEEVLPSPFYPSRATNSTKRSSRSATSSATPSTATRPRSSSSTRRRRSCGPKTIKTTSSSSTMSTKISPACVSSKSKTSMSTTPTMTSDSIRKMTASTTIKPIQFSYAQ